MNFTCTSALSFKSILYSWQAFTAGLINMFMFMQLKTICDSSFHPGL